MNDEKPHRCYIEGSSAVCIEQDGHLWVKEYADGNQREGRTYRVGYCPQCGKPSSPLEFRLSKEAMESIFRMEEERKNANFEMLKSLKDIRVPIPDPEEGKSLEEKLEKVLDRESKEIHEEIRKYACMMLNSIINDMSMPTTHMGFLHSRSHVGMMLSLVLERIMSLREWIPDLPFFKFDPDWEVKVVPNFAGSVARFFVKKDSHEASIYLDCYDCLGCMFAPYWEVYCMERGTTYRYMLGDEEGLMKRIRWIMNANLEEKDYEESDA